MAIDKAQLEQSIYEELNSISWNSTKNYFYYSGSEAYTFYDSVDNVTGEITSLALYQAEIYSNAIANYGTYIDEYSTDTGSFTGADMTDGEISLTHTRNRQLVNVLIYKNGQQLNYNNFATIPIDSATVKIIMHVFVEDTETINYIIY